MKKLGKWLIFLIFLFVAAFVIHRWGAKHAQYMTGGTPHPSNCLSCHLFLDQDSKVARLLDREYISPLNLALVDDDASLLVTAQESNQLLRVDTRKGSVIAKIPVGSWPHTVITGHGGEHAYVSNHWSQNVSVIDLTTNTVINTIEVGAGPSAMVLDHENRALFVVNSFSGNLSIIDLETGSELRRIPTGNFPIGIAITPDGRSVYVTHRRSRSVSFRQEPVTELAVIDLTDMRVERRIEIKSAYQLENIAFTPSGDLALFTLIRPKNLVPSTQIERGWMITEGIGVIETAPGGKMAQLLLDEPNNYFADPYDLVISPDGGKAYVSHAGVDRVSVLDIAELRRIINESTQEQLHGYANHLGMSGRFVTGRIKTGFNPKGLAISSDGANLYIAERFSDEVSILNTKTLELSGHIDLGGPGTTTMLRKGGRLFFNAGRTFQNQYSCSTCHPDGGEDGLTYDLTGTGRNLENTITLRELSNTSPFKWNGKNVSVYMQCGMRFSKFVTRTESFEPDELNALVAFMFQKLENPPNPYQRPDHLLTEAQLRGKEVFERTTTNHGKEIPVRERCITCHPPPYFTDRSIASVGSRFETDTEELFDTPKLNNIVDTPPYLHDGRATTLEEIWTIYGGNDSHGYVNDMTKQQLNDLIEYLRSIGPSDTYANVTQIKQAR